MYDSGHQTGGRDESRPEGDGEERDAQPRESRGSPVAAWKDRLHREQHTRERTALEILGAVIRKRIQLE